jgi:DNA-binding beta-propeller fold protein YncE
VHVAPDSGLACPDGGLPNAYLFDNGGALYTFDPATLATSLLGTPACAGGVGPWTLSVSREGNAYVVFMDPWSIYKVDLTTLACTPTPFVTGQLGLDAFFSIAVSRNTGTEKLFVYGEPGLGDGGTIPNTPPILAQTDLTTFVLSEVGAVVPEPPLDSYPLDMQGDPLGNLFGLSDDGLIVEINSATGAVIGKADTGFLGGRDWAVMSYENQVYLFGAAGDGSEVARYDVATQTLDLVGTIPVAVLGASAVPCLRAGIVLPPPP